jgi:hypothetical protein
MYYKLWTSLLSGGPINECRESKDFLNLKAKLPVYENYILRVNNAIAFTGVALH